MSPPTTSRPQPPSVSEDITHEVRINDISNPQEGIAIIGMACRLPGGIRTPEELWELLKTGKDAIGELPPGRWEWPSEIDPAHQHQGIDRGGFLEAIDCFDAPFFRLSPKEVELMDPQQRILLELSWETLEDAGYAADALSNTATGVFMGASGSDYSRFLDQASIPVDAHFGTGSSMAVLANRISYFYDFYGPSLQIDTACSSSLVAVHKGVQSIESGGSSQALVGGVNVICHPATSIAYYKASMLAEDGRCKTFDQRADGYVRAEGAVMMLLKPLRKAMADQDPIHAVIKGTACNHGGQASSLTVPNPERQAQLLQGAWKSAHIAPETIGYIEAHGTGTSLGDPIEVRGLKEAFSQASAQRTPKAATCGLSSIKSNLGHLEAVAGIAGLLKVVLSLKHRELAASLNFEELNPYIDLAESPFHIVDHHQPWLLPDGESLRRAGVSSFGSGGANAHVILEEYQENGRKGEWEKGRVGEWENGSPLRHGYGGHGMGEGEKGREKGPYLIVLSAKNEDRLREVAKNLYHFILSAKGGSPPKDGQAASGGQPSSLILSDMAYTLQRRQAMEERAAFFVHSMSELKEKLESLAQGEEEKEGSYRGNSKRGKAWAQFFMSNNDMSQVFEKWILEGKIKKVAKLWVKGVDVNWELFYETKPKRISLPTYPFARERYWAPVISDRLSVLSGYNSNSINWLDGSCCLIV